MPTLQCPNCKAKVTFEGIAGICPSCASVVRAPTRQTDISPAPRPAPLPPRKAVKLSDIEDTLQDDEPEFNPPSHDSHHLNQGLDKGVLYTIIGSVAVVLIFTLYVLFGSSSSNVATTPPAAPAPISHPPAPPPAVTEAVATPEPQAPPTPTIQAPPPSPAVPWAGLHAVRPKVVLDGAVTDERVGQSIQHAADFLINALPDGQLPAYTIPDALPGADALCVYALLHGGNAVNDPRLAITSPIVKNLLDRLKAFDITGNHATYSHSIRASALSLFDRPEDRSVLQHDFSWLVSAAREGAYGYIMPAKGEVLTDSSWDNSNSQYGMLGVWAGTQAGLTASDDYWNNIEQHWIKVQAKGGGWNYVANDNSLLPMTVAGITSLSVALEQQTIIGGKGASSAKPQVVGAIQRALDWLGADDQLLQPTAHTGYTIYGIERAALATGFKTFGSHDWYREWAALLMHEQAKDGSWGGTDGAEIETAFRLLFLARGRHPLFINKLRFAGEWNNRPRDASKLADFGSHQLEQQFAWGVADLSRNWSEWMDCPLLFISTDTPPDLSADDAFKLRQYTDAGGIIFVHRELDSPDMDGFVDKLTQQAFSDYQWKTLPPDHPLYSLVYPLPAADRPPLKGLSNGQRLLVVYCPTDITKSWVAQRGKTLNSQCRLGVNLAVYAAGLDGFRRRLATSYVPPPDFSPSGIIPVARITYSGAWDPEPGAWLRFPRWFQTETSLGITPVPTTMHDLNPMTAPVAVLTGNAAVDFEKMDLPALRHYVDTGGILLIDSAGGSKDFIKSVREHLLPKAFPEAQTAALPASHPILAGGDSCTDPLPKPRLRRYASEQLKGTIPALDYLTVGKGTVIISDLDITTGLLDTNTWGITGYTPTYCQSLVKNIVLWTLTHYQ